MHRCLLASLRGMSHLRRCAGIHLAKLEFAVFLLTLIRNYDFEIPYSGDRLRKFSNNFTTVEGSVPIILTPKCS